MNKYSEMRTDPKIVARLDSLRMTRADRQAAMDALHSAERLVDAFVWLAKTIERVSGRLFLKPALRH